MNIRDVLIEEGGRLDEVIAMAMEDLKKAAEDKEYRRRLYREFGLDAETE